MDTAALAAYSSGSAPYLFLCRPWNMHADLEQGPVRDHTPFLIASVATRCQREVKPDGVGSLDDWCICAARLLVR